MRKSPVHVLRLLPIRLASFVGIACLMVGMPLAGSSESQVFNATQSIHGIAGNVDIIRDKWGIPTIRAGSDHDLFFGLGFAMATDRLWQMDGSRRLAEGRVAEVAGVDQIHWDMYHRTLGLAHIANEIVDKLDPATRDNLQAFADGVNAYIGQAAALPFEFLLMNYKPEPWQITDSLAIQRLVVLWLEADSSEEEEYQLLIDSEGDDLARKLFPHVPDREPDYTGSGASSYESDLPACDRNVPCFTSASESFKAPLVAEWFKPLAEMSRSGHLEASNIWAVDGTMTESHEPILAMDPHLNYFAPSILYEARLDGGDLHCWGATFPGVPVLPFGANDKICWGPSDLPADSQDLYLEKLNPSNPREYEVDGKWVPFDVINEQIPSKAADGTIQPYLLDVLVSKHGPVVEYRPGEAVALRWTGSDPTDDFTSFFKVMRADSLAGFYEAFRDYSCPPQNYCVAEAGRRGKVGQVIAGHIPIRKGYDGTRPVDGSVSSNDWVGFIPYNQLPHRLNPPEHFVAHANNIPRGAMDQCKQTLGVSFSPNYRVNRIIERLLKDKPLTPEKMREIQMDDVDTTARFFVPAILGAWDREGSAYPGLAADVEMLRGWDYRLNESSVAATLYQVWLIELARGAIVDHLRQDSSTYLGYEDRWLPLLEAYLGGNGSLPWLDSDNRSARDKHVLDALQATIARLRNEIGVDPRSWAWGSVHSAVFPHPSGMAQLIGGGSHPWGGGRYTIRVGHYDLQSNLPFQNDFGTVFRAVAASSGGKWEITAVMPPGEGGSSLGPHFTDQMEMWLSGEQREVPFGKTELEPAYSIRLTPAGP